jgi:hypothetical protein
MEKEYFSKDGAVCGAIGGALSEEDNDGVPCSI